MKPFFAPLALTALLIGGCASPELTTGSPESVESIPKRAIDRGNDIETDSNINQINQALMMIKQEGNGAPATLADAKRAAKVPDEMWFDKVAQKPLAYDATTGTVGREGAAPGAPSPAGSKGAPGGINIPGGGGFD